MKVFRVSEFEWWAAESAEEARADYRKTTGEEVDEDEFLELNDAQLDDPFKEFDENERPTGRMTSFRLEAAKLTEAGCVGCTEW